MITLFSLDLIICWLYCSSWYLIHFLAAHIAPILAFMRDNLWREIAFKPQPRESLCPSVELAVCAFLSWNIKLLYFHALCLTLSLLYILNKKKYPQTFPPAGNKKIFLFSSQINKQISLFSVSLFSLSFPHSQSISCIVYPLRNKHQLASYKSKCRTSRTTKKTFSPALSHLSHLQIISNQPKIYDAHLAYCVCFPARYLFRSAQISDIYDSRANNKLHDV